MYSIRIRVLKDERKKKDAGEVSWFVSDKVIDKKRGSMSDRNHLPLNHFFHGE